MIKSIYSRPQTDWHAFERIAAERERQTDVAVNAAKAQSHTAAVLAYIEATNQNANVAKWDACGAESVLFYVVERYNLNPDLVDWNLIVATCRNAHTEAETDRQNSIAQDAEDMNQAEDEAMSDYEDGCEEEDD